MSVDGETLSNLIKKSINIQYDEKSFTYEVHARSDTTITVTIFQLRQLTLSEQLNFGPDGFKASLAIGDILCGGAVLDNGRDTSVPLVAILRQLGTVREDNRVCTVKLKLSSES